MSDKMSPVGLIRALLRKRPNVATLGYAASPYMPPLTAQVDRFDVFLADDAEPTYGAELPEWDSRRLIGH